MIAKVLLALLLFQLSTSTAPNDAHLANAKRLVAQQDYQAAENELRYCLEHSFAHVEPSDIDDTALQISRLLKENPQSQKMIDADVERLEEKLLEHPLELVSLSKLSGLYGTIVDEDRGIAFYDKVKDQMIPQYRVRAGDVIRPDIIHALLKARRYDDILENASLNQIASTDKRTHEALQKVLTAELVATQNPEKAKRLKDVLAGIDGSDATLLVYYEALLHVGRDADAAWAAQQVLALGHSAKTYMALSDAARRAGKTSIANDFADQAKSTSATTKP